jgi:hypothetical protein
MTSDDGNVVCWQRSLYPTGEVASKMSQFAPDWRGGLQDVPICARLARWPPRCPSLPRLEDGKLYNEIYSGFPSFLARLARWPPRCPSFCPTGEVASKMSQFAPTGEVASKMSQFFARLARWPPRCPRFCPTGEMASKMSQFMHVWRGGLQDVPVCVLQASEKSMLQKVIRNG